MERYSIYALFLGALLWSCLCGCSKKDAQVVDACFEMKDSAWVCEKVYFKNCQEYRAPRNYTWEHEGNSGAFEPEDNAHQHFTFPHPGHWVITQTATAESGETATFSKRIVVVNVNAPKDFFLKDVVATPDSLEKFVIYNYHTCNAHHPDGTSDLVGYTVGDKANPTAFTFPNTPLYKNLLVHSELTFGADSLGIDIDDNGEILYLRNPEGEVVHSWSN